ncbi:SDR family oxidoreductase [Nocardia carnea]|uniref:SDR family oxidoreductase n=1 Tax=Nocardia carnea TaxID=37328 RepID=UPI0024540583|nr:NAD(P)-dependent oxidoreductase [Nocardia carnea]
MKSQPSLSGLTILMSGGSRGIGSAIAVRAARAGANIAFVAKTDVPDKRLPGTVHTAAAEIESAGGRALPIIGDIRDDETITRAVTQTVDRFGGIDIVVNNASAITLSGIGELSLKRYDLMQDINTRGTFALTSAALPHLLESRHPHVLTLSPPLNPDRRWLAEYAPYTVSKYGMTMLTLGVAEQYRERIAANCLWPRTLIATAAVQNIVAGAEGMRAARRPEIMADAAAIVLGLTAAQATGRCFIDEDVLTEAGISNLDRYLHDGATATNLVPDLFL